MRPFQFARLVIVVNAEIDVRDSDQVMTEVLRYAIGNENVVAFDGASDSMGEPTRRLVVDATHNGSERPRQMETEKLVNERWAEYGLGPEAAS